MDEQTSQLKQSAEEEHKARREAEQANAKLERKNRELEQFAYVTSHDLQEPLRTTSGFVEALQQQYKGQLDERADKYLGFVADASNRMKTVIRDLLEFSRLGAKGELQKVDCNLVLQNIRADLAMVIGEAKADIQAETLPVINGYPTEIKLLFQNLITNAIKFRKKDVVPLIAISALNMESHWEFAFSDNGIGIDKKYSEKIFVIFQRLHNRTEYEGSGIGLAHCKKIVELLGGQIWLDSIPGEGTTFYFTIPK